MKKLFVFHMIAASLVFSGIACQNDSSSSYLHNFIAPEWQTEESFNEENFLDEIAAQVRDVTIIEKKPTYYDYARVALNVGYVWCLCKPFNACKYYLQRLAALLTLRKKHEKFIRKTSI